MSDWFSLRQNQNDTCNCCNQGRSFGFADGLRSGFMPGGIFSYTTYGMINGDYSFYNPVPSLDMFTYFPGMNTFNSPCGLNFDSNLFTNLLGVTAMQMNQQSFWNSINGGNNIFGGMNFNTPFNFGFNGVNGNNGNNGSGTPQTEEEKAAKKKYDTMKAFLEKYATYRASRGDSIKDEIKEIDKLKITEHDEETDKDKTRNATYAEKLEKMQELLNGLKSKEKSKIEEFIVSENSGLLVGGNGSGNKEKSDSITKQLEIIGYERNTAIDENVSEIKTKLSDKNHGDNITQAFGWFENAEVLDAISSYNTINGTNFMSDVKKAYSSASGNDNKELVKKGAMRVANKLLDKARDTKKLLDSASQTEFDKSYKKLNDAVTKGKVDDTLVKAFNELYTIVRVVEARNLVNEIKVHYNEAIPGMFDFIITETEKDLKDEKIDASAVAKAKGLTLGEEEVENSENNDNNGNSSSSTQGAGSTTHSASVGEELATLASNSTNIKEITTKDGKSKVYEVTVNGSKSYYTEGKIGTNAGKLLKFNPEIKKYEQTTETIDDIKKNAIEISENTADYSSAKDNASGIAARLSSRLCGRTDKQEQGGIYAIVGLSTDDFKCKKKTDEKIADFEDGYNGIKDEYKLNSANVLLVIDKYNTSNRNKHLFCQIQFENWSGRNDVSKQIVTLIIDEIDNLISSTDDETIKTQLEHYKEVMEKHQTGLNDYGYTGNMAYNYGTASTGTTQYAGMAGACNTTNRSATTNPDFIPAGTIDATVNKLIKYLKEKKLGVFAE